MEVPHQLRINMFPMWMAPLSGGEKVAELPEDGEVLRNKRPPAPERAFGSDK